LDGLWALEWDITETNLRCVRGSGICMRNLNSLALIVSEISAFIRTACQIDSASDPDQEYIYFMGSETLPSACYILSDESGITFYSTSNGYKNRTTFIYLLWERSDN